MLTNNISILPMSGLIPSYQQSLSSSSSLACESMLQHISFVSSKMSTLSIHFPSKFLPDLKIVRMGGGPRTYPGGVSKWQWKRMQAKKAKQLLQARLARERQIYEMRKRAELKAAVSELERPWEAIEKAPTLFSSSADEQLKVLADRFQKPGGFDLWSERDGPELFRPDNGQPSMRFFPKGVVHSVKPYGRSDEITDELDELGGLSSGEDPVMNDRDEKMILQRNTSSMRRLRNGFEKGRNVSDHGSRNSEGFKRSSRTENQTVGRFGANDNRRRPSSDSEGGRKM